MDRIVLRFFRFIRKTWKRILGFIMLITLFFWLGKSIDLKLILEVLIDLGKFLGIGGLMCLTFWLLLSKIKK